MSASGKKKGLLIAFAFLAFSIIAGAVAWRFFLDAGAGPERGLPRLEGEGQILVKTENPKIYKGKLLAAIRLMGESPRLPSSLPLPDEWRRVFDNVAENLVNELTGLLDVAEQAAFLAVPGEGGEAARFYISFIPDERAFGELIEGGNPFVAIEKWEGVRGREGWIARPALSLGDIFGELPALYLLRSGTGRNSPVLAAGSPEAIDEMRRALSNSASRVRVTRHNPAPDYIQARYPVQTPSGERAMASTEIAWIEDETSAHAQFYTDAFSLMTGRSVPKSGLRGDDLPLLGSGDLAFIAAADIPYACFAAFPSSEDPIAEALKTVGSLLPAQYREDLRAVLAEGRISAVVVDDGGKGRTDPSTAYLVLESKASAALTRLMTLPKLLMKSASLAGWDSCHTLGITRNLNLILAQRGDVLLLGMGGLSEYGRTASIPGEIEDFAAPRDLADLVATPSFWNIARPHLSQRMGVDSSILDALDIESCTVHLRVITPEKADIGFYWKNVGE